jgi:glutamate carboxypeptidase
MDPRADPAGLLPLVRGRYTGAVQQLERLVGVDSGSWSPAGVNRVADLVEARLHRGGWAVDRRSHHPALGEAQLGDVLIGRRHGALPADMGGRRVLLMAHMDTVFDDGSAAARPFRVEGPRAYGPGVTDDKAGIVTGIEAVEVLCDEAAFNRFAAITLLCTPDEEIGSLFSKPIVQELAREHDVAIGLEAARLNGNLVSARKGIAVFAVDVAGREAHAGVRPHEGVNAALEAAHKTIALQGLNRRWPDVTCNVGVIRGGSRTNVVAGAATVEFELRAARTATFDQAVAAAVAIVAEPTVPGTSASIREVHRHPPMERTEAVAALAAEARAVAGALGFEVGEQATGGAGDANTSAALGVPTIDGFAPIGGDAHAPGEWLDLDSLVPRVTLLAGVLARLGAGG